MDYKSLYECILHAYITLGIDTFPIDCFELVKRCGFRVVKYSDLNRRKKAACRMLSDDACLLEGTLYYEAKAHPQRVQFTIAHEFGHAFLQTDDEDRADEFASHFLAPRILIHKYGYRNAEQLHDAFGLSYRASNRALISYKEWFRNISYSITRKPTEPEQQLEHIFFPESNPVSLMEGIVQPARKCYTENDEEDGYSELNELSDFMRLISRWRGNHGFCLAENKWLYGNDL